MQAYKYSYAILGHRRPERSSHRISSMDWTLLADKLSLVSVVVCPTDETSRSDWAELTDMHRTERATAESMALFLLYFWAKLQVDPTCGQLCA